jgi:hypothetical protein
VRKSTIHRFSYVLRAISEAVGPRVCGASGLNDDSG